METEDFYNKFGREEFYIFYDYEQIVMRVPVDLKDKYIVKHKGEKEYQIAYDTDLAVEIKLYGTEITKEEYENFLNRV